MPEFLARPDLPNQLANSLVQLAAHENDPIAEGIARIGEAIGRGLTSGAEHKATLDASKARVEAENVRADREMAARREEHRTGLLTELVKNDQVVKSLLDAKPMNQTDADLLLGKEGVSPGDTIKNDFGSVGSPKVPNPAAAGGIETAALGLPGGFTVVGKPTKTKADANRWVRVDDKIISTFPALKDLKDKDISTAQYIALTRQHEASDRWKGTMDDKLWARAKAMANEDMDYVKAAMDGDTATVERIINQKKRIVMETGGRLGDRAKTEGRKALGSIIADAFEKGLNQP